MAEEPSTAAPEVANEEPQDVQPEFWSNNYGFFDGHRFCLRSFPVCYRRQQGPGLPARLTASPQEGLQKQCGFPGDDSALLQPLHAPDTVSDLSSLLRLRKSREESGVSYGVEWNQTLGKMVLRCALPEGVDPEDLVVEMSCWQLQVSVRHHVEGLQRLENLCGDLFADIHHRLSWWQIDEEGLLQIILAKIAHKPWNCPWHLHPRNVHHLKVYPFCQSEWEYYNAQVCRGLQVGEELRLVPPGEPQDTRNELLASVSPEGLCTGVDEEEDTEHAVVVLHLDEENLETAVAHVPLEELFGANVEEDTVEVFVSGVGCRLCWGSLAGLCVPELTTWEVKSVKRRVPPQAKIRAPAYYNLALRITLVKADNAKGFWGGAFTTSQGPEFQLPRERLSWTELMQRALVLSPTAPMLATAKTEQAQKLCLWVECSQDAESARVVMHLHHRLGGYAGKYKLDLTRFFSMRVADRMLEISVVADAEFSMCYGWFGGSCVPEQTSWELARYEKREKREKQTELLAESGGGEHLTVDEGIALQQELLAGFGQPNFRHRLLALRLEHTDANTFRQERKQLLLAVQSRALPRFGFEGNAEGVLQMTKRFSLSEAASDFDADARFRSLASETNVLLGLEEGSPPRMPELIEDQRFLGKRVFSGKIAGTLCIARSEGPRLQLDLCAVGLVMSGPLKPLIVSKSKESPGKDVGPWLRAVVEPSTGRDSCLVELRLDEATEDVVFNFRRPGDIVWVEGVVARTEAKVAKERQDAARSEEHFAVEVKVAKAPSSLRQWKTIFTRVEPGQPMPAEQDDVDSLGPAAEVELGTQAESTKSAAPRLAPAAEAEPQNGTESSRSEAPRPPPQQVAVLFPGQGSQYVGMLARVQNLPAVKTMLSKAKDILGYDLLELCLNGPEEKLEETRFCQPALFVAGLAGLELLPDEVETSAVAGLSLGEYTALCTADVLSFEDALHLVRLRGEAMHEAAGACQQGMLTVVGLKRDRLEELCEAAATSKGGVCSIANCLFPDGFVVGGTEEAICAVREAAENAGAIQAKVLKTAGAFHTRLMQPAQERLAAALEEALPKMRPPRCTIWMNASAEPMRKGVQPADIVVLLKKQLTSPVLWEQSVRGIIGDGVSEFYEVGPMKQLRAMMKRIDVGTWKTTRNVEV